MQIGFCNLHDDNEPRTEFTDWTTLKHAGYNTRTNYKYDHHRVVKKGERANAVYVEREIVTAAEWRENVEEFERQCQMLRDDPQELYRIRTRFHRLRVTRLPGSRFEVVRKEIPVFHQDQTRPGNFRERTKAIIRYGNIFWRPSKASNYIKKSLERDRYDAAWFTKDFDKRCFEFEPFQFLNERKILEHLNQRNIYGGKADPNKLQWWSGSDLDLHIEKGGNPDIFLRQVEAVLSFLDGKGWIVCLGADVVDGIHVIKIHQSPKPLHVVRADVQDMLNSVSRLHPQLEQEAIAAGMKPIWRAEIYPDADQGFRLPLGIGYTALTNKPLGLVKYHTYRGKPLYGADVVGLMTWDGTEMPLAEKLEYIRERVPRNPTEKTAKARKTTKAIQSRQKREEAAVAKATNDKKLLGSMKGRYRKVLIDFYSGKMQVPKSLQTGILLGVNALWAQEFPVEDRTDFLLGLLQDMTVTEKEFSSRLWDEDWPAIRSDIDHVVATVERLRAAPPNKDIEKSNKILRRWAGSMKQAGFDFGNPATWSRCWEGSSSPAGNNFFTPADLTEEDLDIVATEIAPVFVCPVDVAAEAVAKMVRLAHVKDRNGDGMSQEYRRAVLHDEGIYCQENSKLAACWRVVEDAGFIYTKCGHVFNKERPGEGRAIMYAVGSRVRKRFITSPTSMNRLPEWLVHLLLQDVSPPPQEDAGDQWQTPINPDWFRWNTTWLGRVSALNQTYPLPLP